MSEVASRNRRRARRYSPKRNTRVSCLKGSLGLGRNLAVAVLDVSESGARLRLKEAVQPGQEVEVSLDALQLLRPVKMLALVMWCIAAEDGTHCIGVRFDKLLSFSVLQSVASS